MFRNMTRGAGLASMASAQALLAEKKAGTNARWQAPRDGRGDGAGGADDEVTGPGRGDAGGAELAQAPTAAAASTQAAAARAIAGILATTSTK
jgi:hypothetical protein